jgi:hypothetical protein
MCIRIYSLLYAVRPKWKKESKANGDFSAYEAIQKY